MRRTRAGWLLLPLVAGALFLCGRTPNPAGGACGYFTGQKQEIAEPGQAVFLSWDPRTKVETLTVQPKFAGNAPHFALLIPTPARPKVRELPRDFFKHLAVFTTLKQRAFPASELLDGAEEGPADSQAPGQLRQGPPAFQVVETEGVGSLNFTLLETGQADALHRWLKDRNYHVTGSAAVLDFYVQRKWPFTAVKIDTKELKRNRDGTFAGEVAPVRLEFPSEQLVYPLLILQTAVKDRTEVVFYVQAPFKADLPGDMTYQYHWVPLLEAACARTKGEVPGRGAAWLQAIRGQIPDLLRRSKELGFEFGKDRRPPPNRWGRTPTTLEWAKRLTAEDVRLLRGETPYSEKVPDVDEGFAAADLRELRKAEAIGKVLRARLAKARADRPQGYLVRAAPAEEVRGLRQLVGVLQPGQFLTRFRHVFTRNEMTDDLVLLPARRGDQEDSSEYEEVLPTAP
jgi:hypothetical protein